MKSAANALEWGTTAANTLQEVLTAGDTAIEDINLTGDIALTGNLTGTGSITRTGTITASSTITSDTNIVAGTTVSASSYKGISIPAFPNDAGTVGLVAGDFYQTDGTAVSPLNVAGIIMIKQ